MIVHDVLIPAIVGFVFGHVGARLAIAHINRRRSSS